MCTFPSGHLLVLMFYHFCLLQHFRNYVYGLIVLFIGCTYVYVNILKLKTMTMINGNTAEIV